MEPKINYVALLVLIILGVAVGNLVSSWFSAQYIEGEVGKVSTEISKVIPNEPKKIQQIIKNPSVPKIIENPRPQEQNIEQRKLDDYGIRLAKTCREWEVAHKDMNTLSSKRGMMKHCERYQDYINTGNLPHTN